MKAPAAGDRTVAFEKLSFPGGAPTPEALADIATASAIAPVPMRVRPQRSRCRQAERLNLIGACNLHPGELALNLSSACGGFSQEPACERTPVGSVLLDFREQRA